MFPSLLFLYFTLLFCNCTNIKLCTNNSHPLDKRSIETFSNLNPEGLINNITTGQRSFDYYPNEQVQFFYNPASIHKRSQYKYIAKAKEAKKLFELMRRFGLSEDEDLTEELKDLKEKYNITVTFPNNTFDGVTKTLFKLPIPTYYVNLTTEETFHSEYDDKTIADMEYYVDITETELDTTTVADYDPNLDENYDDEVEFRQAKNSERKNPKKPFPKKTKKPAGNTKTTTKSKGTTIKETKTTKAGTTGKKGTGKTVTGKTVKGKTSTGKTVTTVQTGTAKAATEAVATEESEASDLTAIKLRKASEKEAEVITIVRVRGIWLGGRCRCNWMIRSSSPKINKNTFSLLIIYILFLYYII